MRADRIEISQKRDVKGIVGFVDVFEYAFDIQLGRAVRICRGEREVLADRYALGLTVYRRRRRKYQVFAAVLSHYLYEIESAD